MPYKNKEDAAKASAKYREQNKEKISESNRIYREENRDRLKEYSKEYYEKNKEEINKTIACECGQSYCGVNMQRHLKSDKHVKRMEIINEYENPIERTMKLRELITKHPHCIIKT